MRGWMIYPASRPISLMLDVGGKWGGRLGAGRQLSISRGSLTYDVAEVSGGATSDVVAS